MPTISVRVDDETAARVAAKAEKAGVSVSDYLRNLMDDKVNEAEANSAVVEVLSNELNLSFNALMGNQQDSLLLTLRELLVISSALKGLIEPDGPEAWQKVQDVANVRLSEYLMTKAL